MIIRSQDKRFILNFDMTFAISIADDNSTICAYLKAELSCFTLGKYRTKEQCIKILDDLREQFTALRSELSTAQRDTIVYVLVNYWSTVEEDLFRIYWLRDHGFLPYVMIYDKQRFVNERGRLLLDIHERFTDSEISHFKICQRLPRWVNSRNIFWVVKTFDDYLKTLKCGGQKDV